MTRKNPSAEWEALKLRVEQGKRPPEVDPERLMLRSVKLRPEVFQQRTPAQFNSDAHIRELTQAVKAGRSLEPLVVWWDGRGWTCIDGHHRMAAYRRVPNINPEVPVRVFAGSPEEALAFSARSNTRDKLQMSHTEKVNAAWRLVVLSEVMTKAQLAEASCVSERQVAYMRRAKAVLLDKSNTLEALSAMAWMQAKREADGNTTEWDADEEDKRVVEMAAKLRHAVGKTAERQPVIFAQAVEKFSPMLAAALRDYFGTEEEMLEDA